METKVVHCKRDKYDVYIGRPGKWGNPFIIGKDGNRDEVIEKFRQYLYSSGLINQIDELKDKVLGCWCSPNRCHGDILVQVLKEKFEQTKDGTSRFPVGIVRDYE